MTLNRSLALLFITFERGSQIRILNCIPCYPRFSRNSGASRAPVGQEDKGVIIWDSMQSPTYLSLPSTRTAPTFYTLRFYSSFLGKLSNLSPSTKFLLHTGQLSPREVKQLDQGHPVSGSDGTKVSFLITLTIIWLSRGKRHSPYPVDLEDIRLLNSEKGQAEGKAVSRGWESIGQDTRVPALTKST